MFIIYPLFLWYYYVQIFYKKITASFFSFFFCDIKIFKYFNESLENFRTSVTAPTHTFVHRPLHPHSLSCKGLLLLSPHPLLIKPTKQTHTLTSYSLTSFFSLSLYCFLHKKLGFLSFCFMYLKMALQPDVVQTQEMQQQHFHVLAVDDSLIERKLLERLLRKSSCKGTV